MIHARRFAGLTIAFLIVVGCHSESQAARLRAGVCNPAAAATLAGKTRISDRSARRLTGASIVRQIKPGQAVTMDYRQERITIETDNKTAKIVRAFCG